MSKKRKQFLAFALALLLVLGCFPSNVTHVHAADAGLTISSVPGLGASYTQPNNGTYSWKADGTTITGSATGYKWILGDVATTTTLTLKNTLSVDATLSFDWATTGNGSVSEAITGKNTASGSYEKTLAAGASVKVKLQSGWGSDKTINLQLTNVKLTTEAGSDVSLTFRPAENGSYTVNGTAITAETAITAAANTNVTLVATANAGYKLFGWWDTAQSAWISADTTLIYMTLNETTLYPYFISDTAPVWGVGKTRFTDLQEAANYANSGTDKTVYLAENGTLPAGDYTIPAGVTLLIPFDDDNTVLTEGTPLGTKRDLGMLGVSYSHPEDDQPISTYRALIMDSGAKITVNGALNVGGKHNSNGYTCAKPVGPLGMIQMQAGSQIILNNGANLHCWGFIYGGGTVTAKSGSTVHELFQFTDFRGGNATGSIAGESKVFPFSQYYVQNVEVPITYEHGAKETVWTTIHVDSLKYKVPVSVDFVGTGDSALFAPEEGGTIVKRYDPATDRLSIDVNGGGYINSMKLSLAGNKVDSADFPLPLNSNITVNVNSGTVTANQSLALLPGAKITIAKNATLEIAKASKAGTGYTGGENLFIYSRTDWLSGNFVHSGKHFASVVYSPDKVYNRTDADLVDAVLDVNGTLITDGFVYTSEKISTGGIISSGGTGKVVMNNCVGQDYITWQTADNGSTYTDIVMYSAWLRNGNGEYLQTATYDVVTVEDNNIIVITSTSGSNAWAYCAECDNWAPVVTIKYEANGGSGSMAEQVVTNCGCHKLTNNGFSNDGFEFKGWTGSNGKNYTNQATIDSSFDGTVTLTANWKERPKTVTITWHIGGKTYTSTVDYGEPPVYNGDIALTKGYDNQYHYTFAGWSKTENGKVISELPEASENADYYAVFTPVAHQAQSNSHKCSCGYTVSTCADTNKDHKCDVCGKELTKCADNDKDHKCDVCGKELTKCADNDKDHKCDTCDKTISDHNYNGWSKDDTYHWHACTICGGEKDKAPHGYVNGKCECGQVQTFAITVVYMKNGVETRATINVEYGKTPDLTEYQKFYYRSESEGVDYLFNGWDNDVVEAKENATYTAKYVKSGWQVNSEGKRFWKYGVLLNGWFDQDGKSYYLSMDENGYAVTGVVLVPVNNEKNAEMALYAFNEDGEFLADTNGVYVCDDGTFYLENGKAVAGKYLVRWEVKNNNGEIVDVCYYYFADSYEGIDNVMACVKLLGGPDGDLWVEHTNDLLPQWGYYTDGHGAFTNDSYTLNGIQEVDGVKYYFIDGLRVHMGMIKIGDDYYYAKRDGALIVGKSYYCVKTIDLMKEGTYTFDEEGKMIQPDATKNGILEEDGSLYYYVKGERTYAGLIEINGSYYYVKTNGEVVHGQRYWITKTNDLLPETSYNFAEDGKMILTNGIVEEDGSLYYYVNGNRTYAGLIEINGSYYYVKTNGEVVHGQKYWISKTNGLMGERSYTFADDGKMVDPEIADMSKDGIVEEDGSLYYYENGVRTYAGLIEIDGDYYYVKTSGEVIHGRNYWISKTNGLLPERSYTFAEDGKLIFE